MARSHGTSVSRISRTGSRDYLSSDERLNRVPARSLVGEHRKCRVGRIGISTALVEGVFTKEEAVFGRHGARDVLLGVSGCGGARSLGLAETAVLVLLAAPTRAGLISVDLHQHCLVNDSRVASFMEELVVCDKCNLYHSCAVHRVASDGVGAALTDLTNWQASSTQLHPPLRNKEGPQKTGSGGGVER